MRHRTDSCEKLSRALQLHEQGVSSSAIGERLGMSPQQAARTISQAKERRAMTVHPGNAVASQDRKDAIT